jgi:hypothetical protein
LTFVGKEAFPLSGIASGAVNLIVSLPFIAKSVCPLGMLDFVRLVNVTVTNPTPPSEVLQSKGTLPELGFCAKVSVPGKQRNAAANTVSTNIVYRFIVFSFGLQKSHARRSGVPTPSTKQTKIDVEIGCHERGRNTLRWIKPD